MATILSLVRLCWTMNRDRNTPGIMFVYSFQRAPREISTNARKKYRTSPPSLELRGRVSVVPENAYGTQTSIHNPRFA